MSNSQKEFFLKRWNAKNYETFTESAFADSIRSNAAWTQLTRTQGAELIRVTRDFVKCYGWPDFDSYLQFKTAGLPYTIESEGQVLDPSTEHLARLAQRIRAAAEAERGIRNLLGEERYGEYLRGKDPSYRRLVSFMESQNITPELAPQIYAIQQAVEGAISTLRASPAAPNLETSQLLSRIRDEAQRELLATLGADAFQAYRSGSGAGWLRRLDSGISTGELPGMNNSVFTPASPK